jgi:DNA-directed RNA polymerase specialized sigma24 family protein
VSPRGFAAGSPTIEQILRETRAIRGVLRKSGVACCERDDVAQDVVLAAWLAIRAGRYQPDPAAPPALALRRWLVRIAYYTAVHHRERAHRRREVAAGVDPWKLAEEVAEDAESRLGARSELMAVLGIGEADLAAVIERACGATLQELSVALAAPLSTVARRLDRARRKLGANIGREGEP